MTEPLSRRKRSARPIRAAARPAPGLSVAPDETTAPLNVLVLGMHRSGTSAVAGALQAAGLFAGEIDELGRRLRQASSLHRLQENPEGFGELRGIVEFNDRLLMATGGGWWDTPSPMPAASPILQSAMVEEGRSLVQAGLTGATSWVLKDPRISILLPWWRRILLDRFVAVVCVRPPREVAWSLAVRDGFAAQLGLSIWAGYYRHLALGLEGLPVITVNYDALTADAPGVTPRILSALESLGVSGQFDADAAAASIRPVLRRSTEPTSAIPDVEIPGSLSDLARLWAGDDPVWVAERFAMVPPEPSSTEVALLETHRRARDAQHLAASAAADAEEQRVQLEERRAYASATETERDAARDQAATLSKAIADEREAARSQVVTLSNAFAGERQAALDQTKALSKAFADEREASRQQLETLSSRLGQSEAEASARQGRIDALDRARADLEQRLDAAKTQISERNSRIRQAEDGWSALAEQVAHLNRTVPGRFSAAWSRFVQRHTGLARMLSAPGRWIGRLRAPISSPLFDRRWYTSNYPDVATFRLGAYRHYRRHGTREGRAPNPFFDTRWYLDRNPDVRTAGLDPLDHYLRFGATEGRDPSPRFKTSWYVLHNPDVLAAGINPLVHFLRHGYAEGRTPIPPAPPPPEPAVVGEPIGAVGFPEINSISPPAAPLSDLMSPPATSDVRLIALYLPQFHPIPENDAWWGEGFTEWRNVASARPQFPGHYQPHVPGELGFYDLRLPETRQAQADLARSHGIHGFCYYHYWFNGKHLLERPFDEVLASGEPDLPFALCWANDPWSRKWDGREDDLLQAQTYSQRDDLAHIRWLIPALSDPRAITVEGRPMFLVYRGKHLPDPARTTDTWRKELDRAGLPGIYLVAVETPWDLGWDATAVGFDAKVLFQPQFGWLTDYASRNGARTTIPGKDRLEVYDYAAVRDLVERIEPVPYRRYETVVTSWDNSARVGDRAVVLHGATPEAYEEWLVGAIARARSLPRDERIVFVNSWNEWAEGCHLEPDLRNGRGFLEATLRAVSRRAESDSLPQLVRPGYAA